MTRFDVWRFEPPLDYDDYDPFAEFCRVFAMQPSDEAWAAFESHIGAETADA